MQMQFQKRNRAEIGQGSNNNNNNNTKRTSDGLLEGLESGVPKNITC